MGGSIVAATDGGMRISIFAETGFEIVINKYGNSVERLGVNITAGTGTYAALQVASNNYSASVGSDACAYSLQYAKGQQ